MLYVHGLKFGVGEIILSLISVRYVIVQVIFLVSMFFRSWTADYLGSLKNMV